MLRIFCYSIIYYLTFVFICNSYALNLDKIKISFLSGDYKAAITQGEKIISNTTSHSSNLDELYYILGLSYLKDGNSLRASDIFEIILKEFKDSAFKEDAKLGLGDAYFLRGDYSNAQAQYQEILRNNSSSKLQAPIYYRLSLCAAKLGNLEEREGYLSNLKQGFPLSPEIRINNDLSSPVSYYTVQVGSFSSSINAKNLTEKLIQKGYLAYIEEANSGDKIVYRVRVGKSRLRQEAQELESKLCQEGYPTKIYP